MTDEQIARINELYHKSKAEGLSEEEKKEQKMLREQYIATIRNSVVNQLNNISIQNEDGTVTDLGEKFGKKAND